MLYATYKIANEFIFRLLKTGEGEVVLLRIFNIVSRKRATAVSCSQ